MKINKHIEIVRATKGHRSAMGQASSDAIQAVLERHYQRVGVTIVNDAADLDALVAKQPDLVFLGVRKVPRHIAVASTARIWTADYLEQRGIIHTGSPALTLALDIDKPVAKRVVMAAGLPSAASFNTFPGQYRTELELPHGFPLFLKPPASGGSKGIGADSVVRDFASFERKVLSISQQFHTTTLAETYLTGREFSVAMLATPDSNHLMAMPIELITEQNAFGDRILGKDIKTADTERAVAVTDSTIREAVMQLAIAAFQALGARDYGRIDIRLDSTGRPNFIEANLMPGLSSHGYLARCFLLNQGSSYEEMILSIAALGLAQSSTLPFIPEAAADEYPSGLLTPLGGAASVI